MRNAWKGLTVGAFAGAGVGVVLDLFDRVGRRAGKATTKASDKTKSEARHVAGVIEDKVRRD
ncbi:MAG: hypothetical protein EA389_07430 [Ilumatobacter sp.]|nr:MAG: hypothetical protein EA389_07430 [Ilumatobacter sp.]